MSSLKELKALAEAAQNVYPMDVDDSELIRDENHEHSEFICPMCESAGTVEEVTERLSKNKAVGLQVFGIGESIDVFEDYLTAANPATILTLISALEKYEEALKILSTECDYNGWDENGLFFIISETERRAKAALTQVQKIMEGK